MGSHSVTCHPAEVTFPPLPQPKLVLDSATPEGCKAELTYNRNTLCWQASDHTDIDIFLKTKWLNFIYVTHHKPFLNSTMPRYTHKMEIVSWP